MHDRITVHLSYQLEMNGKTVCVKHVIKEVKGHKKVLCSDLISVPDIQDDCHELRDRDKPLGVIKIPR
jgi:predicted ATPase